MVKALRRWLEANELPAIVTGVLGRSLYCPCCWSWAAI
jgi:hypothetical protein